VEKFCWDGQATYGSMAHAHFVLDNYDYRHTLRIRNASCFSAAAFVARTLRNDTSYVHCPSCCTSDVGLPRDAVRFTSNTLVIPSYSLFH